MFLLHQIDKRVKSFCNKTESEDDFITRKNFTSSAKSNLLELSKCKSLINNIKSKGAKCEPCGTPDGILKGHEVKFFTLTICFLFVTYEISYDKIGSRMPIAKSFSKR